MEAGWEKGVRKGVTRSGVIRNEIAGSRENTKKGTKCGPGLIARGNFEGKGCRLWWDGPSRRSIETVGAEPEISWRQ